LLEIAYYSSEKKHVTEDVVKTINSKPILVGDANGDGHYDLISAFQKSIRGSDVDAALYYLGRLIVIGDLDIIYRRMNVIAYEDIGLASPGAAARTLSAIEASERLGFPEARIPLSQAVIELCLSPKSNSAITSIDSALSDIKNGKAGLVPKHLKDGHYQGAKDLGNAIGYKYPHNYENSYVKQQYLPDTLKHKQYYQPKLTSKAEQQFAEVYKNLKNKN